MSEFPAQSPLRKIIHIDMDAFFAAVEQLDNPALRGKPIAVGHASERGVVATASYEARKFGIRSAMPSVKAKKLCPELIFVEGRYERYKEISSQIMDIFLSYTNLIEPLSIDEAFLDVTVNKTGATLAIDIAKEIKRRIKSELGLIASAGVSYNKFLAKIASDYRKPDGLCTIHPSQALDFISRLPIESFWGVGPATAKKMHSLGIHTGKDLRQWPRDLLVREFGKSGYIYFDFSRGIDNRVVTPERIRKSIGCEQTLEHDIYLPADIDTLLQNLAEDLIERIHRKHFCGNTITVKIKFFDFKQITRSFTANFPFNSVERILYASRKIIADLNIDSRPIRLMGLSVSNPHDDSPEIFIPRQLHFDFNQEY